MEATYAVLLLLSVPLVAAVRSPAGAVLRNGRPPGLLRLEPELDPADGLAGGAAWGVDWFGLP